MAKKLTPVQQELLTVLKQYIGQNTPMAYNKLKVLCEFKSFESSFNALLFNGYVVAHKTDDFSNQFKLA